MSPAEIALAVGVVVGGTFLAGGFGGLAWIGRRLVSKVDRMDKAVRGDGNGSPSLGEQIRNVHSEVRHVRRELKEHVDDPDAHLERTA